MVEGKGATGLAEVFSQRFGTRPTVRVVSPGRTELAGNHTDHQGGHVIAAAVDREVRGFAAPNGTGRLNVRSEGFGETSVALDNMAPREDERHTTAALARGMAAQFANLGYEPAGFDLACESEVPAGSGLSSSAAFELALGQAMNALWADGALSAQDLAVMAHRCEREWFDKPCGLMDQAAIALGGIQHMSFARAGIIDATNIPFDFGKAGYAVCVIGVGSDHAANASDYAAVPIEMSAVARVLGAQTLGGVEEEDMVAVLPWLRTRVGDRAVLRALHYFREERLVAARVEALRAGDMAAFVEATRLSGASSAMYLQNVSISGAAQQPSMIALALADELLGEDGAARVHGGGFGGTIQAFVPTARLEEFRLGMDAVFGAGACRALSVGVKGASFQWL